MRIIQMQSDTFACIRKMTPMDVVALMLSVVLVDVSVSVTPSIAGALRLST